MYNLERLYATLRKRRGRAKILASAIVTFCCHPLAGSSPTKIVFVRQRTKKRSWLALLSTDANLSEGEVVRFYGERWEFGVFFKMCKIYLKLSKELQGRSYDMLCAHTTIVCIRYIMLALESRHRRDHRTIDPLFYACCDELRDLTFVDAIDGIRRLYDDDHQLAVFERQDLWPVRAYGHFVCCHVNETEPATAVGRSVAGIRPSAQRDEKEGEANHRPGSSPHRLARAQIVVGLQAITSAGHFPAWPGRPR